jgi:hypothetical protein
MTVYKSHRLAAFCKQVRSRSLGSTDDIHL